MWRKFGPTEKERICIVFLTEGLAPREFRLPRQGFLPHTCNSTTELAMSPVASAVFTPDLLLRHTLHPDSCCVLISCERLLPD